MLWLRNECDWIPTGRGRAKPIPPGLPTTRRIKKFIVSLNRDCLPKENKCFKTIEAFLILLVVWIPLGPADLGDPALAKWALTEAFQGFRDHQTTS